MVVDALGGPCPAWAAVVAGPGELGRFGPKGLFLFLRYFVNISNRLNDWKFVVNSRKIIKMPN